MGVAGTEAAAQAAVSFAAVSLGVVHYPEPTRRGFLRSFRGAPGALKGEAARTPLLREEATSQPRMRPEGAGMELSGSEGLLPEESRWAGKRPGSRGKMDARKHRQALEGSESTREKCRERHS